MKFNYSIIIKSKHWPRRLVKIRKIVKKVLKKNEIFFSKDKYNYSFNIILLNDILIKKYNKIYKGVNKPTDVLTFTSKIKKKFKYEKYYDIMISAETSFKYAIKNNKNFYDHLTHLIIHSILHIKGYSHKTKKNYKIMQKKEIEELKKLGISNPYL